jgi:diguanylate cyclase (GGDEF)-like protein
MGETVLSIRSGPRIAKLLGVVAAVGLVALAAYALEVTAGLPGGDAFYNHGVYATIFLLVTTVLLMRGVLVSNERGPWLAFAAAWAAHLLGWLGYWIFVEGDPNPVYPSPADAFWLMAYVLECYALVLLLRARSARFDRALLLDGAVVVLALTALSASVVVDQIVASTGGSTRAVLVTLAYPLADLVVVATVVTIFALSAWRPDRSWALIGLAFTTQAVGDSIYLYQTASGSYEQGTALDVVWPLGAVLIAFAAWVRPNRKEELALEGWRMLAVPGGFTLVAIGLLVYGSLFEVPAAGVALATATLALAGVRSVIAFRGMLQLAKRHEQALDAALRDSLTGLRNHRAFHETLEEVLARESAAGQPVCLVLLDLVDLKTTNDTLGHQAGDERLKLLSARLLGVLRTDDTAYRVGGDEFAVVLPGVQSWDGFNVATRLQQALSGDRWAAAPAVSIGVAEAEPGIDKDALIGRASAALVEAKRSHRKTVLYSEGLELESEGWDAAPARVHTKTLATALARAVDAKDSYTRSHCETVAEMCVMIAAGLGLEPARVAKLRLAGLLHDVGKIGIPDTILQKPSALTAEEFDEMKTHSQLGYSIVSGAGLEEEAIWILHHHERPDGRGYPDGLAGDEIALESRVILVADAFEAMTSDRPYRRAVPASEALAELHRHVGRQFDPDCVAALEDALMAPRAARGDRGLEQARQRAAHVAGGVEERRRHDPEEDRGGREQDGHQGHLGLGSHVRLG